MNYCIIFKQLKKNNKYFKKRNAPAIGTDLGTTNSFVGVWQNDKVNMVPNDMGDRTTPSYVAFTNTERIV